MAHTRDFSISGNFGADLTSSPHVCLCSTKTCPTTGWTGWASRPPCTGTRTAPGPCRRCTSTMGPSCTLTSTRTPPTPTPCLPVWAHRLTTLSREIKTRYTGRCEAAVRGLTGGLAGSLVLSRLTWDSHECCRCRVSGVHEKRRIILVEPGTAEQSWRYKRRGENFDLEGFYDCSSIILTVSPLE